MARDRERAAERKRRARQQGDGETPLHEDDQPINASGEVDEFEAALATGAGPEPAADEEELDREAEEASRALGRPAGRPGAPTTGGGPRFVQFIRASWAELQRVQWPDRRAVAQATAVTIGFVIIAGAYLGVADYVAQKIVDFII